ncbi:MAG: uracil-DNA glycosylase [Rhizobiales bacterium]|nr:uracil-DNA glycosylase [Hyphomicrobiales bacterium]
MSAADGGAGPPPSEPPRNCPLCPRLAAFREGWREREPDWHNAPVPSFGAADGRLLIVGLAPGLRGANRTGRPFTGDFAGELLYATMLKFGFAAGDYRADPADGLRLVDAAITNAVRCVPPENKPVPAEIRTCRVFLAGVIEAKPEVRAILALGRIAHESVVRALEVKLSAFPFGHGAVHECGRFRLHDSYHCSRYNTNTGVLTTAMFEDVFDRIRADLAPECSV